MAPVQLEPEVQYLPVAIVIGHVVTVLFLIFAVSRSLYRSYLELPPAPEMRSRLLARSTILSLFASLACLSLLLAGHTSLTYASLSYKVWATRRGVDLPIRLYGDHGIIYGQNLTEVHVARWLTDTSFYIDALEIVAERARRFWWGQQIDLATLSWTLLLAVEGRRRNIPFLWAFPLLAQLVNLSFAQNLFYVALLLTSPPIPAATNDDADLPTSRYIRLRDAIFPPKPANWCPNPLLFLVIFVINLSAVFILPHFADTSSFASVALFARVSSFLPLLLPSVIPVDWGTIHPHPHSAYGTYTTLFRFLSAGSFILHGKATVLGLLYNASDAHYHRHSTLLPFDEEEQSTLDRTTTAFGKVLGATADHPVIAGLGRDVLLCGLSLGLWAAVRALDSRNILASSTPFFKRLHPSAPAEVQNGWKKVVREVNTTKPSDTASTVRRRGRAAKTKAASLIAEDANHESSAVETPPPKRRGRPRKIKTDLEEVPGDTSYIPSPAESVSFVEKDVTPEEAIDYESSALVWGLATVGGLGCASAGVFGGECISR